MMVRSFTNAQQNRAGIASESGNTRAGLQIPQLPYGKRAQRTDVTDRLVGVDRAKEFWQRLP
jgi:hypothetical protein